MPAFSQVAEHFLRPGDTFVDVGAGNGVPATLVAARLVGNTGQVIAVEPDPTSFLRLCQNVQFADRGNIQCLNLSLPGTVDGPPPLRLDLLFDQLTRCRRASFIRVNVPGAELALLRSLEGRVNEPTAPSFIFHIAGGDEYEMEVTRLEDLLEAADYRLWRHGTMLSALPPAAATRGGSYGSESRDPTALRWTGMAALIARSAA